MLRILFFLIFLFFIDWYSYQAFKTLFTDQPLVKIAFWAFSVFVYLYVAYGFITFDRGQISLHFGRMVSLMVLSLVPKLIVLLFLFGEDIIRFIMGVYHSASGSRDGDFFPDRRKFISQTALVV